MKIIRFYQQDGRVAGEQELSPQNVYNILGMMVRCKLYDNSNHEGFVCFVPGEGFEYMNKRYGSTFFLWTWAHLDETTHKLKGNGNEKYEKNYAPINYHEVEHIDAILYSNPRWGGLLHNHFFIDTRPYLTFEDVQYIFKEIWCNGYEKYWYRHVWNLLNKRNLTRYTTEYERCLVLLRAVAVSIIYEDFCKVYCQEDPSYDYSDELYDDISELIIGQMYGEKYPKEIIEHYSEAIFILANDLRREIVSIVKSKMTDCQIFAHFLCTAITLTEIDENDEEVDFEIKDFDDYMKAVEMAENMLFTSEGPNEEEAFFWITEDMPLTGSFY